MDELNELIRKKDNDLNLAAEIGQQLVIQNDQLKHDLKQATSHYSEFIESLEFKIQQQHDLFESERKQSVLRVKELESKEFNNNQLIIELRNTIQNLESKIQSSNNNIKQPSDSNPDNISSSDPEPIKPTNSFLKIQQLQLDLVNSEQQVNLLKTQLKTTKTSLNQESIRSKQAESKLIEYESCLEENNHLKSINQDLLSNIQELKDHISTLETTLSSFDSPILEIPTESPISLLGEIEDRKQAVEKQNQLLSKQNQGLIEKQTITLNQQDRLKNQISRLTQLSISNSNHQQLTLHLKNTVSQLQSENKHLLIKLNELSSSSPNEIKINEQHLNPFILNKQNVSHFLSIQVEDLKITNNCLKKQIESLQFTRIAEQENYRSLESKIHDLIIELNQLKIYKINQEFNQNENDINHNQSRLDSNDESNDGNQTIDEKECLVNENKMHQENVKPIELDKGNTNEIVSETVQLKERIVLDPIENKVNNSSSTIFIKNKTNECNQQ